MGPEMLRADVLLGRVIPGLIESAILARVYFDRRYDFDVVAPVSERPHLNHGDGRSPLQL